MYRERASHPSAHHQQPPLQPRRTYKIVQAFLSSVFFHSQVNSLFQVKICLAQSVWWANFQTYLLVGAEWKYVARKGQEIWLKIATISARQQTYTRKGCRELTNQFYASFMSTFRRRVEGEDDRANCQESRFRTGASKNLPNKLTKGSYTYTKTKRNTSLKPSNRDYIHERLVQIRSSWA